MTAPFSQSTGNNPEPAGARATNPSRPGHAPHPVRLAGIAVASALTLASAAGLFGVAGALAPQTAVAAETVSIYSYRQEFLLKPLLEGFKKETGIDARVVYLNAGTLERLKAEGANSPADVVMTADVAQMVDLAEADLLQPVSSATLEKNVPAQYQDPENRWFGLTTRGRVIFVSKDRVKPGTINSYEDLARPDLGHQVCIRSGKHPYNITLLASIIAHKGVAAAEDWARGLKANLARKPQSNDRNQVKAVKEGVCDIAVANTYYMGLMATNEKEPEQKTWAEAVRIVFPNQPGESATGDAARGTHVNASAGAVTKHAPNRAAAVQFLEFLTASTAQAIYAAQNFEYPVKAGTPLNPVVASWGAFKADTVSVDKVAKLREEAEKIMDRVGFDL